MKKILTVILDGFGYREEEHGNAIKMAQMDNFNKLWEEFPHTTLFASEEPIGLKEGQFGNSEIGHMTIGAGHIVKNNNALVDNFIENELADNDQFLNLIKEYQESPHNIHIMGMASDKDVHSNIQHMLSVFKLLKENNVKDIYFHLITDGRDTAVDVSYDYIKMIEDKIKEYGIGSIATVCGRYYAMDRDKKWDRTKQYYDLITRGIGISSVDIKKSIENSYKRKITDEFINPVILNNNGLIKNGDTLIWTNFRSDRARQILTSITDQNFAEFATYKMPDLKVYCFLPVDKHIKVINFMKEESVENPLGIYLSQLGLTQARIAETEKYAHVTYFFDGMYEGKIDKCDKFLLPSPKVATYDLEPQMSAIEVTKKVIACMEKDYDFILVNFANPDMVGHTGNLEAAVKACISVDICLGKLMEVAEENFYKVIVLSDHGNIDTMLDENNNPVTTHTLEKVPFIITDKHIELKKSGDITQVAPTILDYMDIATPKEMAETESLIIK
ncbi:MAG: 2,3-bisphosphoglycerate-independent phosphoglycerate mutase [Bacilli bacterium]|nr:2,3-bisphosphoglycerate-independent phosphoglycerate mutase [Bacilli bacterium]